jgi:hypothetical protein
MDFLPDLKMMPVFRGNCPLDFLMEAVCVLPISLFHPSLNGIYTNTLPKCVDPFHGLRLVKIFEFQYEPILWYYVYAVLFYYYYFSRSLNFFNLNISQRIIQKRGITFSLKIYWV